MPITADPKAGIYICTQTVSLSGIGNGNIYSTTDGSTPTTSIAYTLQSAHPYSNNFNYTWTINVPEALKLRAHFSYINTECNCDKLTLSSGNVFTGNYTDTWSNWVSGNSLNITLKTDSSITKNGFYIDKIEYISDGSTPSISSNHYTGPINVDKTMTIKAFDTISKTFLTPYNLESAHPYKDNFNKTWPINVPGASQIREHFTLIRVEGYSFDTVTTSSGNTWSGKFVDVWSNWSTGDTLNITLKSDGTSVYEGFYIDKIEYVIDFQSPIETYQYTIVNLDTPKSNYTSGFYDDEIAVSLASSSAGDIYYTLNITDPIESGILYTGPITLNQSAYLNAVCYKKHSYSKVVTYLYNILVQPSASQDSGEYTGVQTVALSTTTLGSSIIYTLDGSVPSASNGLVYAKPITIDIDESAFATRTLKAVTLLDSAASPVSTFTYQIYKAKVIADPPAGYINAPTYVTLTAETEGEVYYTLDGSEPTTSSALYTVPILIDKTSTLKTFLYIRESDTSSKVCNYKYTYLNPPVASPDQGKYTILPDVTLSTDVPKARIYYTLDESVPNNMSTLYTGLINLTGPTLIKAVIYIYGKYSQPITYIYNKPVPPTSSLPEGEYVESAVVGLSTPTISGKIYYTTDGTEPSITNGTLYTDEILLTESCNLKAVTVENPIEGYVLHSPHPYPNNFTKTWTITAPAGTNKMRIHFSKIEIESGYDFLTTSTNDIISGTESNVWSNWASGDTITITLQTDGSKNFYGFSIDMIEYISADMSNLRYSAVRSYDYKIINVIKDANIYQRVYVPSDLNMVDTRNPDDPRLGNYNVFINGDVMYYIIKFTTCTDIQDSKCTISFNSDNESGVRLNLLGASLMQGTNSTKLDYTPAGSSGQTTTYELPRIGALASDQTYAIVLKTRLDTSETRETAFIKNSYDFFFTYRDTEKKLVSSPYRTFSVDTRVLRCR